MNDSNFYLDYARKAYMGADFRKSCEILTGLKPQVQGREWLVVQQHLVACHRELMQIKEINVIFNEVNDSLHSLPQELHSKSYYILSACASSLGNNKAVQEFSDKAISLALMSDHREDLQHALFSAIMVSGGLGDYERAMRDLEKLELLLRQSPKADITASVLLVKIKFAIRQRNFAQAEELCWMAYDFMKVSGFYIFIPMILCNLAYIQIEQKSFSKAEAFVNLAAKGFTAESHPFLFTFLKGESEKLAKLRPQMTHDLEIELDRRIIRESTLGLVDFKNQHTLLDLALLLIRNPDQIFGKEELVEKVWKQSYRPQTHDNLIYVTVRRLRELLEPDIQSPRYILKNRQGYFFNPQAKIIIKEGCSL